MFTSSAGSEPMFHVEVALSVGRFWPVPEMCLPAAIRRTGSTEMMSALAMALLLTSRHAVRTVDANNGVTRTGPSTTGESSRVRGS